MPDEAFKINICAILSMPRVGWNDAWGPIYAALSQVQMPVQTFVGGLWHGELERAMDYCWSHGFENVLTLDYDSIFTPWHLNRLLTQFHRHPEFGAIAGMQCRRTDHKALFSLLGSPKEIAIPMGVPFKVDTAHFGFTAIRLKELQDIPKPWFKPEPAPDGTWDRGECLDADISFWQRWHECGKTLGMCADVRIGHLEVMASYMDDGLNARYCTVAEWHRINDEDRIPVVPDPHTPWIVVGPGEWWYMPERRPDTLIFFEPRPEACEQLRKNYPYAEIIEAAVDAEEGEGELHIYNKGRSSSLDIVTEEAAEALRMEFPLQGTRTVKKVKLSKFCQERGYSSIGFLSLDAQGRDLTILRDMAPWLNDRRIGQLEHECHDGFRHYDGPDNSRAEAEKLLRGAGYKLVRAKPVGSKEQDLFWSWTQ